MIAGGFGGASFFGLVCLLGWFGLGEGEEGGRRMVGLMERERGGVGRRA